MKSKISILVAACLAGIISGHLICRSIPCRNALGLLFKQGKLLAVVHGAGIYESDGANAPSPSRLIANEAIKSLARDEAISTSEVDREYDALQSQFRDRTTWLAALGANWLSSRALRAKITDNLRAEKLLTRQLAPLGNVSEGECREYFAANPSPFSLPTRFRVSHLFLAAPPETAPEIVDVKKRTIDALAERIAHGEKFADLIAVFSEDEATKARGGDLSFFSEHRMPPDFIAAVRGLRVGEIGKVVRAGLGFHILQLIDIKPARQMTFDEVKQEIMTALENQKRAKFVPEFAAAYAANAEFVRQSD